MATVGDLIGTANDSLSAYIDAWKNNADVSAQTRLIRAQGEQDRLTKLVELQYQNLGGTAPVRTTTPAGSPAAAMAGLPTWAKWGLGLGAVGLGAWMVAKLAH